MHYYQFHIGDYQSDTRHLELMEDLAYRRMLDLYYKTENPLPLDESEIARLIGMRTHSECIAVVLKDFFERTDEGWRNNKADEVLAATYSKSEKARRSAKARWAKKPKEKQEDNANAMRTHSEGNADGMLPITHYPLPITQDKDTYPAPASPDAVFSIPTNKYSTKGETYPVTQHEVDHWQQIYPSVDTSLEMRKIIGWADSNPAKRKTKAGMKRFINSWLSRAQDRGGGLANKSNTQSGDILGGTSW